MIVHTWALAFRTRPQDSRFFWVGNSRQTSGMISLYDLFLWYFLHILGSSRGGLVLISLSVERYLCLKISAARCGIREKMIPIDRYQGEHVIFVLNMKKIAQDNQTPPDCLLEFLTWQHGARKGDRPYQSSQLGCHRNQAGGSGTARAGPEPGLEERGQVRAHHAPPRWD